jgi:hypothetical protein
VRKSTGAPKVVLVGLSRGGYPIRDFIANGGAAQVSHAILGGVPNHGVWSHKGFLPGSEFNGQGPVLLRLNAPQGPEGNEVTPGVQWLTIRSDNNDKYAQPDGVWIGQRGTPTGVSFDGPALKGAQNVVIAGIDHRETALGPKAFAEMWRFPHRAGAGDARDRARGEGRARRQGERARPRQPRRQLRDQPALVGATVEVYAIDAASGERFGPPRHVRTVGADGRWGPFATDPTTRHEFVVSAPGYATTHVYRSPFPRSSQIVSLRPDRLGDAGPRRRRGGRDEPAARLLRRAARPHRPRRREPAGRHPAGRRGTVGDTPAPRRRDRAADRRGVQRRAHRRPHLARRRQPCRPARADVVTGRRR